MRSTEGKVGLISVLGCIAFIKVESSTNPRRGEKIVG
jgi:hypothetical protein